MKVIKVDLPADLEEIELHVLSDWHIGDSNHDAIHVEGVLDHIKKTPNAYCVLDGDLMDSAIAGSVGDSHNACVSPMDQLKLCVKIFKPLADAGKILAIVPGNHEKRVSRATGIDTTAMMASQLGLAHIYSSTAVLLFIRFGHDERRKAEGRKIAYSAYIRHGSGGGGKRVGGKLNNLEDMANIVDADIYCMGHTHQPAAFRKDYHRVSIENSSVKCIERLFVNTASSLNFGGYGEEFGFSPASKINPVIFLCGTRKRAFVVV
jgi:predicted phosphodiesterase